MKVLFLKINDQTHTTGKITAFLSKEALKIQKESIALAKIGKGIQVDESELNEDAVIELLDALQELRTRKAWLICEIYGNKFTVDDLEKELSDEEIEEQINQIYSGITGVVSKN